MHRTALAEVLEQAGWVRCGTAGCPVYMPSTRHIDRCGTHGREEAARERQDRALRIAERDTLVVPPAPRDRDRERDRGRRERKPRHIGLGGIAFDKPMSGGRGR